MNIPWIQRAFKKWRWVHKRACRIQLHKYTQKNLTRYLHFLGGVWDIPWSRLKFADECHFVARDLMPKRGWGEMGEPLICLTSVPLASSFSLTLLTRLDKHDTNSNEMVVFTDVRENSNTQWDFLEFVFKAIQAKALVEGVY